MSAPYTAIVNVPADEVRWVSEGHDNLADALDAAWRGQSKAVQQYQAGKLRSDLATIEVRNGAGESVRMLQNPNGSPYGLVDGEYQHVDTARKTPENAAPDNFDGLSDFLSFLTDTLGPDAASDAAPQGFPVPRFGVLIGGTVGCPVESPTCLSLLHAAGHYLDTATEVLAMGTPAAAEMAARLNDIAWTATTMAKVYRTIYAEMEKVND